jgi:hypothetical protein
MNKFIEHDDNMILARGPQTMLFQFIEHQKVALLTGGSRAPPVNNATFGSWARQV